MGVRRNLFKPRDWDEQGALNEWFDRRLQRLEFVYYVAVAELSVLTPLTVAIAVKVFGL